MGRFRDTLRQVTSPGSLYLTLAANANDPDQESGGPPRVQVDDLYRDLAGLFELVQLREFHFDGVQTQDRSIRPLAWSALWRRRST